MEAIIVGFTEPTGSRKYFGALILACYNNGELIYIGHTGTGFSDALLNELYDAYRYAGFEVMGISVDKKDDFNKWTATIKKEDLKWPNYLDENGVNSALLAVNYFPFNFLLNSKGEIIKKNISMEELKRLLEKNLKIMDKIRILN